MTTTKFAVWYMRPEFFRDGLMGYDWLKEKGKLPDPANLSATHVHLKDLELEGSAQLERVYYQMQGDQWSPNGEARELIEEKGLLHTSMSMGDVVVVDLETFIVDRFGFTLIEHPVRSEARRKAVADHIDGYDRDDIGESPDF